MEDIDDVVQTRGRKKTFQKKFGIDKDYLEKSDLKSVALKMNIEIPEEEIEKLFDTLDKEHCGKVKLDHLLQAIVERPLVSDDKDILNTFYDNVHNNLVTKADLIYKKLKNLKTVAAFNNDETSIDTINW